MACGASRPRTPVRQSPHCCSQREEHTCQLLEAATLQAEEAGISDEEPDVQLALMAAEMRYTLFALRVQTALWEVGLLRSRCRPVNLSSAGGMDG